MKKRIISLSNRELHKEWVKLKKNLLAGKFGNVEESKKLIDEIFKNIEEGDKTVLEAMSFAFAEGVLSALNTADKIMAKAKREREEDLRYIG